jgi:hypothetical protein
MKRRSFIRQIIWAGVSPGILLPRSVRASRSFNGTDQYFLITSTPVTNYPMTLAAWVRRAATGITDRIMGVMSGADSGVMLDLTAGNVARARSATTSAFSSATGATTIAAETWVHCCGVFASDSSRVIYLNGVSDGTSTTSRAITGVNRIIIGVYYFASALSGHFAGQLADVVVFNRALSAAEVAQLYTGGPRVVRNGLVFWTRMTEAGDLKDLVGGRTLTAFNAPPVSELHPRTR